MKKATLLLALPVLLLLSGCLGDIMAVLCAGFPFGDEDHCFQTAAVQESEPDTCEKIEGKGFTGQNPPKDKCYLQIAVNTCDAAVCDKIEGGITSYSPEECQRDVAQAIKDGKCEGKQGAGDAPATYSECLEKKGFWDSTTSKCACPTRQHFDGTKMCVCDDGNTEQYDPAFGTICLPADKEFIEKCLHRPASNINSPVGKCQCVKDAHKDDAGLCVCDSGYHTETAKPGCWPGNRPLEEQSKDCFDHGGLLFDNETAKCTCPENARPDGGGCTCNEGYEPAVLQRRGTCTNTVKFNADRTAECNNIGASMNPKTRECDCPDGAFFDTGTRVCMCRSSMQWWPFGFKSDHPLRPGESCNWWVDAQNDPKKWKKQHCYEYGGIGYTEQGGCVCPANAIRDESIEGCVCSKGYYPGILRQGGRCNYGKRPMTPSELERENQNTISGVEG